MTNKILFNLIGVKLTEQDLSALLVENDYELPVRFLIGGGWYRWDGTNFRGFDGAIVDASPGDIGRVEIIGDDEEDHEQWHVTAEQLADAWSVMAKRRENLESSPNDSRNRIDSSNPLMGGAAPGGTVAVDRGTSDTTGAGAEAQLKRERDLRQVDEQRMKDEAVVKAAGNEPVRSEVHPGAELSAASGPGEIVSA